ncbi:MAG: acyl carrier protein [Acidobacteria bacterium]|nr:acyl carrier protein [Acidobacteriota bacterium]
MAASLSAEAKVADILSPVVGIPADNLLQNPDRNLVDDLGLDSLGAVRLLVNLEKEFAVKVPADRLTELFSIRSIASVLDELARQRDDSLRSS